MPINRHPTRCPLMPPSWVLSFPTRLLYSRHVRQSHPALPHILCMNMETTVAVTSKDIPLTDEKRNDNGRGNGSGWRTGIVLIGWSGLVIGVVVFGGVFWAINGGFSVIGLGVVASAFNDAGTVFWSLMTQWTFDLPGNVPGVPQRLPVLPWAGVLAASMLQVSVILLRLLRWPVPRVLGVAAGLFSLYDFGTTYFGLGTAAWMRDVHNAFQFLLTIVITFIVEAALALILEQAIRALRNRRKPKGA